MTRRKLDAIVVVVISIVGLYALARLPIDFFSRAVFIISLALVGALAASRLWYEQ